jgi:hypothetical protein
MQLWKQMSPQTGSLPVIPFAEPDRVALVALWRACDLTGPDIERSIDFALGRDHTALLVGKSAGELVASVMVGHDGHVGLLYFVAVDPAHRGKGWGRAVMQEAESWLAARGVWRGSLMIRHENAKVAGFYARLGWGTVPNIVMQKRLLP